MVKDENLHIIKDDTLRYKKNKLASTLALAGLVFDCLYFTLLYGLSNVYFSKITIGISVVLTLLTLLFIFLSSEGVKGYNKKFCIVLLVIAVIQILRIFGIPMDALKHDTDAGTTVMNVSYFGANLSSKATFTILTIWLVASAACLVASAVIGYIYAVRLENFMKKVNSGEVDIMATVKAMDEAESAAAVEVEQTSSEEVQ